MSNTTFTDFSLPAVNAAWLNDVNRAIYQLLGNTASAPLTRGELLINLGLPSSFGTMAQQNSNAVAITGGSITGITDLAVADGGTGASTGAQALINLGATGRLIGIQTFTSNGTYTPTVGTTRVFVEGMSAGGGGGGAQATGASTVSAGAGGGSGAYGSIFLTTGFSGTTVSIGTGGVGNSGLSGSSGGSTSLGSLLVITGGGGGGVGTASTTFSAANGGSGGLVTTGSFISSGSSALLNVHSPSAGMAGIGASSMWGGPQPSAVTSSAGANALGFGGGGNGALNNFSQGARAGGNGSPGLLRIYEYA